MKRGAATPICRLQQPLFPPGEIDFRSNTTTYCGRRIMPILKDNVLEHIGECVACWQPGMLDINRMCVVGQRLVWERWDEEFCVEAERMQ